MLWCALLKKLMESSLFMGERTAIGRILTAIGSENGNPYSQPCQRISKTGGICMRRRTFLSVSAAAGLAATARGAEARQVRPGDIPKRPLGRTGELLTIIGQAGGRFPLCSYEDAKAITLRAYELGVNYFDNARIYWGGRSEEVYGDVLPPFRKSVFLTTKSPRAYPPGSRGGSEQVPA